MTAAVERTEVLAPEPALALAALLGVPAPDVAGGEPLPLLWHWLYLLERPDQADLGPDGHPVRGVVPEPPGPGKRRMWAGGRVATTGPLVCGRPASRTSSVVSTQEKQGRSGPLTFVVARHELRQDDRVVVTEDQHVVYRAMDAADPSPTEASLEPGPDPVERPDAWRLPVDPVLLFRYSALTYNAHRIHYDDAYAREVEGYPGLVTHGPLQALAMAEHQRARGWTGDLVLDYRLVAPLFVHQGLVVHTEDDPATTSVRDLAGRRTATGTLTRP